jgi:hypothetical protein
VAWALAADKVTAAAAKMAFKEKDFMGFPQWNG